MGPDTKNDCADVDQQKFTRTERRYTFDWGRGMIEVRSVKLLLAFASTVVLGLGPRGTHDHIFLSHDSDWGDEGSV
jgi:hypothetical protein